MVNRKVGAYLDDLRNWHVNSHLLSSSRFSPPFGNLEKNGAPYYPLGRVRMPQSKNFCGIYCILFSICQAPYCTKFPPKLSPKRGLSKTLMLRTIFSRCAKSISVKGCDDDERKIKSIMVVRCLLSSSRKPYLLLNNRRER